MRPEFLEQMAYLETLDDADIDLSDMPEDLDWSGAVIGKYYKPLKESVSIRLDADMLDWFKSAGPGYQSRINAVLREYYRDHIWHARKSTQGITVHEPVSEYSTPAAKKSRAKKVASKKTASSSSPSKRKR